MLDEPEPAAPELEDPAPEAALVELAEVLEEPPLVLAADPSEPELFELSPLELAAARESVR